MNNLAGLGYSNKTVVVTGGSSGMGAATARILGELGARVHIVDINEPSVPCASYLPTDISNPTDVEKTIAALQTIGTIDHLFCCAGVPPTLGALKCMMINYIGNRQLTEGLIPSIPKGGSIAIISSDAGLGWQQDLPQKLAFLAITDPVVARQWCEEKPEFLRDGYTSSKEMILVWVQQACIALGRERGIRINAIGPCPTGTAFIPEMETALDDNFFAEFPYPLLGRMATADEQAWPLILLNSPLNNVVTGAVLWTDQGFAPGLYTGALDAGALMSKK